MNRILLILYEWTLWMIAILAIPKVIYSFLVYKKYRHSLLPRLGFRYPTFNSSSSSIWVHAVSVGETKAIVSLARELKLLFPNAPLIISSVTETGHAEAKRSLPFADYHVYFPFDFRWVTAKILKRARPRLVILCESDFWYNFLYESKKRGAVVALVNGKISERSMQRFHFLSFFSKRLFGLLDIFCVQNQLYRTRFMEAGAPLEKILITGNLKLDDDYPHLSQQEVGQWRQKLGINVQSHQLVITIGSTHAHEEQLFIKILKEFWRNKLEVRVILVPRHPERFKEVELLLEKEQISWINYSNIGLRKGNEQVILIDAMGLLRMCYQLSDIAVVAGSFVDKVGGHNILEPCWYGKPVLFGPHMYNQLEMVHLIKQFGAGMQVSPDQLTLILEKWIDNPIEIKEMGLKGLNLIKNLKGSTKKTLEGLKPLLLKLYS